MASVAYTIPRLHSPRTTYVSAPLASAAGANQIPARLPVQLADAGRLVMPVGNGLRMEVVHLQKLGDRVIQARGEPCLFVPLLEGTEE